MKNNWINVTEFRNIRMNAGSNDALPPHSAKSFQILWKKRGIWCQKKAVFGGKAVGKLCLRLITRIKKKNFFKIFMKCILLMCKFATEIYTYETHVDKTREKRLSATGSGHGVLRSLAGEGIRKVSCMGSIRPTL